MRMNKTFLTPWLSWLWLILLTLLSVGFNQITSNTYLWLLSVFIIVFLKGQQIVDIFMELKHAPVMWRMLLLGYVVILPGILFTIYIL